MKKNYMPPFMNIHVMKTEEMVCTSGIVGVSGTGIMETDVSNEETSDYLSRSSNSLWNDED